MSNTLQSHFYITLDGAPASSELMHDLETVTVESSVHLPDVATLTLHDTQLQWVDHQLFVPGVTLTISARATTQEAQLFDGEIVEIEPDFTSATQHLVIRAFDRLHRLAYGRHVRSFVNVTDGDIVSKLAAEVGLTAKVGPTRQVYPYILQSNETNLAFLQQRAAALGYLLYVEAETLYCVPPDASKPPLELTWGDTLTELHPRLSTVGQAHKVVARGWDPMQKQPIIGSANESRMVPKVGVEQLNGGNMAKTAYNLPETEWLVADRPLRTQDEADLLAQATADHIAGQYIEAEGMSVGSPTLVAGVPLTIHKVGKRFSGTYIVTSAIHRTSPASGYQTSFTISGFTPQTLQRLLIAHPAVLPSNGLVIGIVTDNNDPQGQGRVKVKFPWLSPEHTSDWARVVSIGAGAQRGTLFLPEINDEVLIGFEMGNIHYPYVLGGLWNGVDKLPLPKEQILKNSKVWQRVIMARTGHQILFDDDERGGGIIIQDATGNQIRFDAEQNSITIQSKGDLTIKAAGTLTLSADGDVALKGRTVAIDGQASVDVTGNPINLN